jgi:hypothetical protein
MKAAMPASLLTVLPSVASYLMRDWPPSRRPEPLRAHLSDRYETLIFPENPQLCIIKIGP